MYKRQAVNTAIIQMQGSVDELIQGAAKTAKKLQKRLPGKAGAYLFIHCGGCLLYTSNNKYTRKLDKG